MGAAAAGAVELPPKPNPVDAGAGAAVPPFWPKPKPVELDDAVGADEPKPEGPAVPLDLGS